MSDEQKIAAYCELQRRAKTPQQRLRIRSEAIRRGDALLEVVGAMRATFPQERAT